MLGCIIIAQNNSWSRGNKKMRKDIGVKIWEFGIKIRELSGDGRTEETKLNYKLVSLSCIYANPLYWGKVEKNIF